MSRVLWKMERDRIMNETGRDELGNYERNGWVGGEREIKTSE